MRKPRAKRSRAGRPPTLIINQTVNINNNIHVQVNGDGLRGKWWLRREVLSVGWSVGLLTLVWTMFADVVNWVSDGRRGSARAPTPVTGVGTLTAPAATLSGTGHVALAATVEGTSSATAVLTVRPPAGT